jgi:bacteriocin biosynthesis cyclodehydratase domain-containing protein
MDVAADDESRALLARLSNPNIRFPPRPRLVPDLRVFPMPDGLGLQFRGGAQPTIVRGRLAEAALAFLVPRLDGENSLADLLASCPPGVPHATLLRTLTLLHGKGLLVAGEPPAAPGSQGDEVFRRQLLYWGRHLDATRSAESATEVQRRLASASLVLVGTGLFGIATGDLLTRSGCADLRVLAWDDDGLLLQSLEAGPTPPRDRAQLATTSIDAAIAHLRPWLADADLLIVATCDAPAALGRAINRLCLDRRVPWLRGNADGSRFDIGPFVQPFASGCYRCMELRQASMQDLGVEEHLYQEHLAIERPAGERVPLGEAIWPATLAAGLLAGEAIRIVSGLATPTLLDAVVQVQPLSGDLQPCRFRRVPRCPDCYRGDVSPAPAAGTSGEARR